MNVLNYKELKSEFRKKDQLEKKALKKKELRAEYESKTKDDKRHNLSRKEEYWKYLMNQAA